ncbi:MAG: sugar nucleotide-binding protein [Bacteroidales bacterium]|nr:sugar nucleotide-binding protein [Bacteroidales bacterium]
MKFFVLGCNGMAGHTISLYLQEQGHGVLGFDRNESKLLNKSIAGDAFDTKSLEEIIKEGKFDTVINCIGVLNKFAENNHAFAAFLNSYFPHFLAKVTEGTDTQVIHMSTDCVFSGKKGCYVEHDLRDGETFYDRSKALGELDDDKNITMRNSIVGQDINPNGIGLLNWFMNATANSNGPLYGYTKTIWTGQTTLQLAQTMEAAAKEKAHGLFNTVPDHSISKCDLIRLFNKYIRGGKVQINPVDGVVVDKSLRRTNWDWKYRIPDYETMVRELSEWIIKHKSLYPHYNL